MRPLLTFWNRLSYPKLSTLEHSVRTDGAKETIFDFSADEQRRHGIVSQDHRADAVRGSAGCGVRALALDGR